MVEQIDLSRLKFRNGQIVYVITDPDQNAHMVTGILFEATQISYRLSRGCQTSWHFAMEISQEKRYDDL